jgi:hypothetical protein
MRLIPHGTEFLFKSGLLVKVLEHNTDSGEVNCRVIAPDDRENEYVDFRDTFLTKNAEKLDDRAAQFARNFRAEQKAAAVRKARGIA